MVGRRDLNAPAPKPSKRHWVRSHITASSSIICGSIIYTIPGRAAGKTRDTDSTAGRRCRHRGGSRRDCPSNRLGHDSLTPQFLSVSIQQQPAISPSLRLIRLLMRLLMPPSVSTPRVSTKISCMRSLLLCLALSAFAQEPGKDLDNVVLPDTAADLARGKKLYLGSCTYCHGPTGDGGRGRPLASRTRPRQNRR